MRLLDALFKRRETPPIEAGPLYPEVRRVMGDVQSYARSHGGEIHLVGVSVEGDVTIRMTGACKGCPMSAITLKLGIEQQLRALVPGVRTVVQID